MTETPMLAQPHGPILVLTLNKPHKLNALDAGMLEQMAALIRAADQDDAVAAIVIIGAGRAFCTGFDMTGGGGTAASAPPAQRQRANLEHLLAIWRAQKPVIAAVDGYALGAGCILACLCDIVLASERAVFGEPEIRYWNPATITILPWIVGVRRAKQMLFYGGKLDAGTAKDHGIVTDILPIEGFFDAVLNAVRPLTHLHPAALAAAKRSVNRGVEIAGFLDALAAGIEEIGPLYGPDSPTAPVYRREVEQIGFREYIRRRDLLFRD
jgi:enoyl-CoA hydratase/carnithine racemase